MRPTVRSRRLGSRLGAYRVESGLSGTELAGRIGIHQASWSKIESGKSRLSPAVLADTVQVLGIPAEAAAQLDELRRKADAPGWWQDYGDILSEAVQMLIELEADASWIRTYEGQVIPGLLQTRDYAERVITGVSPHIRVADIDRYLELRMRRQKRVLEGLRLTAIIGEAAIRQQIGGPGVLREQLSHVARLVGEHDVTVQVVPFTADAHAALGESFVIIQWPDETDPEAVYVDGVTSWTVHERGGVIRSYLHALASVQSQAMAPRESLDLIHDVIKDLR
ncbi:helix-turn-helix transcriptional regulator [Actinokineospora sp. NBRC 105648]|uniref:helix-turn-helix domain-containing protein n=1 Tax=Actinokineospora sp. NBRC 105648 TaxID=3032206 RepID=UPI0024A48293|nr:helix-turn-helix transcriptional regulator [Actinokineospora sp. NBRC 105648]GLZ41997.1 transcriptional regulator [Actinokineospora sp. NBRC 105648]